MKKSTDFIKERAALIEAQKRMHEKAAEEQRDALNAEEQKEFRALQGQIEALNEKIKDAEDYEANQRMAASQPGNNSRSLMRPEGGEQREMDRIIKRYSLHKALRSQLSDGGEKLSGVELEMHQEVKKRAAAANQVIAGVGVPVFSDSERRAMAAGRAEKRFDGQSIGEDSGNYGGNLVPEERQPIIEFLRPRPVVESLGARYLTGLTGNAVFPVNDGGIGASWEGEVDAIARTKNAYSKKQMSPKRLGASVLISMQNLMQSSFDLEKYTIDEMNWVLALALDRAALNGSGSSNVPEGVMNATGINTSAAGTNGAAPTWAQLVQMTAAVRKANAVLPGAKLGWAINPETTAKLQTTPKVSGQPVFLLGDDGKLAGYPAVESTLLPNDLTKGTTTTPSLSAAVFGDWNQLIIGQWGFVDLKVDGLTEIENGFYKIVVNAFYDVIVRQPKAFTVVKDWVTT